MTRKIDSEPLRSFNAFTISLEPAQLRNHLRIKSCQDDQLSALIRSLEPLIRPQACFKAAYIDEKREDGVVIDGRIFTSRLLREHLADVGRVFPFVLTLGQAVDERIRKTTDLLEQFYLDTMANRVLSDACDQLQQHLCTAFALPDLSSLSPGSLDDWPIEEQPLLFSLLGEVEKTIGVRLTESLLMMPGKSISGILFPARVPFVACSLCPRPRCDSRRAPFDREAARKYRSTPKTP